MDHSLWPVRDGPRDPALLASREGAGGAHPVAHAFTRCGFSAEEWRLLHDAGFTPRLFEPQEQFALLELGIGLTNAAYRTTPGSGDLRSASAVPASACR